MTETEELLADLRAVYGELHPHREPEAMQYTGAMLAMGVLLRREMRLSRPAACAPLAAPQTLRSFTLRGKVFV